MSRFFRAQITRRPPQTIWWILLYAEVAPPAVIIIAVRMMLGMGQ